MDPQTQLEIEASVFRKLVEHLQRRTDAQNIDLMILAGFCRNCLAKWYSAEAMARGEDVDYSGAQAIVYGMPYAEWKQKYQTEATPEQLEAMEAILRRQESEGQH